MTGAMVIVGNGTPLQPLVAMLIQMMFLLSVLKMAPYNDDLDDWSSFISSFALTLTTLAGYTLMMKTGRPDNFVVSPGIITNFLIVSNAICFVYQIVVIGYVAYQERLEKQRLLSAKKSNEISKTQVRPINNNLMGLQEEEEEENQNLKEWRSGSISAATSKTNSQNSTKKKVLIRKITQL